MKIERNGEESKKTKRGEMEPERGHGVGIKASGWSGLSCGLLTNVRDRERKLLGTHMGGK